MFAQKNNPRVPTEKPIDQANRHLQTLSNENLHGKGSQEIYSAIKALGALASELPANTRNEAISVLTSCNIYFDKNLDMAIEIAHALKNFGTHARSAVPELIETLKDNMITAQYRKQLKVYELTCAIVAIQPGIEKTNLIVEHCHFEPQNPVKNLDLRADG